MAFSLTAFIAPNYRDFNGYWLKAYYQGTTTPKVMALDSSGSVTVAKLQLNADGFISSAGGALVIPYIDGAYDAWLFPTEAEADANDTVNAEQVADNITPAPSVDGIGSMTMQEAITSLSILEGDLLIISDRENAYFDVVLANTVTPNTFNIVQCVGIPTLSLKLRLEDRMSMRTFGTTDLALQAMDGLVPRIWVDVDFDITTPIVFTNPVTLSGITGYKITPALGLGGGKCITGLTNDFITEHLNFDGTGQTFTPATANTYLIFSGDGATKYYNHKHNFNTIKNASFSDGNVGLANILVTHAIYVDNVDNVTINNNQVDEISGSCIFARRSNNIHGAYNKFKGFRWYSINIEYSVQDFSFNRNIFLSTTPEGCYWGGAVNTVSAFDQPSSTMVQRGEFIGNHFEGAYSYGAVMRIQSSKSITIARNTGDNLSIGTAAPALQDFTFIRVLTRGINSTDKQEPCKDIAIYLNEATGPSGVTGKRHFIYTTNDYWATNNPAENISIYNNKCYSPDATNYWEDGVIYHGIDGGINNTLTEDNYCEVLSSTGAVVSGAIGYVANSVTGLVDNIKEGGNHLVEMGIATASYHLGIGYGAYCDNVIQTKPNTIENFYYGVRTFTSAGATLDKIDDNVYKNTISLNELYAVVPSRYGLNLSAIAVYDPPSLASGAKTFTDVTVTGAALGNRVEATFNVDNDGVIFTGYVRVADNCRIYLENKEATTKDLASGSLKVEVIR